MSSAVAFPSLRGGENWAPFATCTKIREQELGGAKGNIKRRASVTRMLLDLFLLTLGLSFLVCIGGDEMNDIS